MGFNMHEHPSCGVLGRDSHQKYGDTFRTSIVFFGIVSGSAFSEPVASQAALGSLDITYVCL